MVIFIIGGIQLYCTKMVCSNETSKFYVYTTVLLAIYGFNLYYIISRYRQYTSDTLKIAGLLITIPVIMYTLMCQQNCYKLFFLTFFIIFPCIMIIFNFYVWSYQ